MLTSVIKMWRRRISMYTSVSFYNYISANELQVQEQLRDLAINHGMVQCSANYVPLSPVSFLERASVVYGDKVSIVYGDFRFSWRETHQRCLKLASALVNLGISHGDTVSSSCSKLSFQLFVLIVYFSYFSSVLL